MPAHRSSAEAEVRDAVVARLRQFRPKARIMHEINACGFGNRIDVLAVDRAEIIAVEVKSEKDKLDRLPDQISAMRGVAHHVIAALHEKFLLPYQHNEKVVLPPSEARGATVWAFPLRADRNSIGIDPWTEPRFSLTLPLPANALHMLWANELRHLCLKLGVPADSRTTMPCMVNALRWRCTGEQLTKGICAALRARVCIEADDPILEAA